VSPTRFCLRAAMTALLDLQRFRVGHATEREHVKDHG